MLRAHKVGYFIIIISETRGPSNFTYSRRLALLVYLSVFILNRLSPSFFRYSVYINKCLFFRNSVHDFFFFLFSFFFLSFAVFAFLISEFYLCSSKIKKNVVRIMASRSIYTLRGFSFWTLNIYE